MFSELKNIPQAWREACNQKNFIIQLMLSLLLFGAVCLHNFHYLRIWQERPGIEMNDWLMNHLPPIDFSIPIFFIEYCTLLLVFTFTLAYPDQLVKAFQMFSIIIFARTVCIYLIALEPPRDMILLRDPIANFFLHSKDVFVTKDLFFSGHVAALTLLMLLAKNKYVKTLALVATILVSVFIVWQHVHYSLDVIIAPVASYITYRVVMLLHRETRYGLELSGNHSY